MTQPAAAAEMATSFSSAKLIVRGSSAEQPNELDGAPLRLRNELELGFKMVKWIQAIEYVESFAHLGAGQGGYHEDHEFYGYRMPI
jgi:methionine sulfoxide reductase catalytic subunit